MPSLLDKKHAAAFIGVPANTLSYWVQQGTAPRSAKIGRRRMWREEDLKAWIDAKFAESAK